MTPNQQRNLDHLGDTVADLRTLAEDGTAPYDDRIAAATTLYAIEQVYVALSRHYSRTSPVPSLVIGKPHALPVTVPDELPCITVCPRN